MRLAGTTTEQNVSDAADAAGIDITVTTFEDFDQITENFIQGACDVVTADGSALAGRKAKQQPDDQEWVIFPATPISKEPLAPVYPQNQSRFGDVVNWAVYATIIADEKGITQANVDAMAADPPDAETARLLGASDDEQQSTWAWPPTPSVRPSPRWATTARSSAGTWSRPASPGPARSMRVGATAA